MSTADKYIIVFFFFSFSNAKRYEKSYRLFTGQQEGNDYQSKSSTRKNENKQLMNLSNALNEKEFLARTHRNSTRISTTTKSTCERYSCC